MNSARIYFRAFYNNPDQHLAFTADFRPL